MTGAAESPADIAAELARLRRLEQSLRAERERIRAAAVDEVVQLQTALRETAARAAQREREIHRLTGQLRRVAGPRAVRRRGGLRLGPLAPGSGDRDPTGALERVLAAFEREREQLERRARAVADTESRQHATRVELDAEAERLAKAGGSVDERRRLSAELDAAGNRIAKLERQLQEHNDTQAALEAARAQLAGLERVADDRREAEAALLAARTRLSDVESGDQHGEREEQERITALLARREEELERRAAGELERRRDQLEQGLAIELDRRRDQLETEVRADLARRERELVEQMADDLLRRREELEREAAEELERLRAGGGEHLSRARADLREEIVARELELARREEEVSRREIELSLVHRRIGDEERRLQERTWRTGGPRQRMRPPAVAASQDGVSFSEGWRLLAGPRGDEPRDDGGGSW